MSKKPAALYADDDYDDGYDDEYDDDDYDDDYEEPAQVSSSARGVLRNSSYCRCGLYW